MLQFPHKIMFNSCLPPVVCRGRRDRYRMVIGFTTTYVIGAHHHWCGFDIPLRARCTTLCDKVCHWLAAGRQFSLIPPVSSINKTDCHNITEILLKVALNAITRNFTYFWCLTKNSKVNYFFTFLSVGHGKWHYFFRIISGRNLFLQLNESIRIILWKNYI